MIRNHHVFKNVWTPRVGEILRFGKEACNTHDRRVVAVLKADGTIVGHVPRKFSRVFWYFLSHGGKISCEVTAKKEYGKGLEVPCVYKFLGSEKMILKLKAIIQEKPCSTTISHTQ